MSYVIHGAAGAQGNPLLSQLKTAGKPVVAVGRKSGTHPDGTPVVAADYTSVQQLASVYAGADGVFVHLPVVSEEERLAYARNIVAALSEARPRRVVVSTSGALIDSAHPQLRAPDDSAVHTLVRGLEETGLSYAVIAPRLFLENLLLPPILDAVRTEGVLRYPPAADFPVSWSSHLDNADVAAALFDRPDVTGTIAVGQHPGVTGPDLARAFTDHLGRRVSYEPLSPQAFGHLLVPLIGDAGAAAVTALYEGLATVPDHTISAHNSAQRLLGLTPRTTGQWLTQIGL
ncbi:NmrA family NAD(P)-binding protein [Streptomyces sp. SP18BB07]|uniref:NmrA family NAD(P)-binding protein n=1 Tax=Streptomyces sp. SP18BB07 TaxID=3002522 RepID=UPI002E77A869|nr:NAD(P)H-binding protein [Streptomyces sp. SP18BB07]MEE1762436.1 NAD(P)H-binding protein [Streptomyces sp. SP18BB07]